MRIAQVATAVLVAILTFSGLHAMFGHRWYGWHHRYGYDHYDRCGGYDHHHHGYWHDRDSRRENSLPDSTYRLQ